MKPLDRIGVRLVFEGPGLVGKIKSELADCMRRDGFLSIADAVGSDHL